MARRRKVISMKTQAIPKHKIEGKDLLALWDTTLAPIITDANQGKIFREYVEHLYFPEVQYKRWRMDLKYVDLAKDLIEAIITILALPENLNDLDKIKSNIKALSEGFDFCPDRQMAELRLCYYILNSELDPDASLESYIENYVAIEKENILTHVVTPLNSPQNVHVMNYWKKELKDELGLNDEYKSKFGTLGQDRFHGNPGNVLDAFYKIFTHKRIITS